MNEKVLITFGDTEFYFYIWEAIFTFITLISIFLAVYFYQKLKKKNKKDEKQAEINSTIDLPMNWFKFYTTYYLVFVALINIIIVVYLIDEYKNLPFEAVYPTILIQILACIALPIYLFINIPKYKKSTFIVLVIQIILPHIISLCRKLLYQSDDIVYTFISAIIIVIPNLIYFYKRRSLFNK